MLKKKKNKLLGKCPFRNHKVCDEECVFFREGTRYNEQTEEVFPFADCAFNVIAENLEAMHNRTFMLQCEVGQTKNVMALKILADLGLHNPVDVARTAIKLIKPTLDEDQQCKLEEKEKLLLEE
jgi:hypothetical protein